MDTIATTRKIGASIRGHLCFCCAAAAEELSTGAVLGPAEAFARARSIVETIRSSARSATIEVHTLRRGISVLEGAGGNIAVLPGKDGPVLVDAGIGVARPQVERALRGIAAFAPRTLVNTHWHFDHTDGNAWLHDAGAEIFSRAETRAHLLVAERVEDWGVTFPPAPPAAIPSRLLGQGERLHRNGTTLAMHHYGPAHTDSDLSVTFQEANVLHAGDTFWNGIYPFIDHSTGGSVDGLIEAARINVAAADAETIAIPGHGPIGNRADLVAFHEMLVAVRDAVRTLKRRGLSLDDCIAARPTRPFDAKWGNFVITPALFTWLVYAGVE